MPRKVPTSAAATFLPISSGGPPSAPMVITTPSTAATIPSPGKRIGHGGECRDRLRGLVVVHVHVEFHHLVGVKRLDAAAGRHAQRIAHESATRDGLSETWDTSRTPGSCPERRCPPRATSGLPCARAKTSSNIIFRESKYLCLSNGDPPNAPPSPLPIFVRM